MVRDVEAQAREAANRLELASREFASLPPDQLDDAGSPKPKTRAATLAGEIKKLKDPPISAARRLEEAKSTARRARVELERFEGANVVALAKADEADDRAAGDDLRALVNELIRGIDHYQGVIAKNSARVAKAPGPQSAGGATRRLQ